MMDDKSIDEMPAGPKLDALIDERVFGYKVKIVPNDDPAWQLDLLHPYPIRALRLDGFVTHPPDYEEQENWVECLAYSWNIAAAWEVVEWLAQRFDFYLTNYYNPSGWSANYKAKHGDWVFTNAPAAPLAICRVILKAIEGHAARPE